MPPSRRKPPENPKAVPPSKSQSFIFFLSIHKGYFHTYSRRKSDLKKKKERKTTTKQNRNNFLLFPKTKLSSVESRENGKLLLTHEFLDTLTHGCFCIEKTLLFFPQAPPTLPICKLWDPFHYDSLLLIMEK